ncbi:MAG TPA: hypothetical protein PK639_00910 [Candidatus Woesebacteria bacterium]|nr:hypothetical protein [Candidatus Woesebacteria bacterium]
MKKLILALCLFIIATTIFLFTTKSPTPKTETEQQWQTYQNDQYGFSFQYDSSKHLIENGNLSEHSISFYQKHLNLNLKPESIIVWEGLKAIDLPEELKTMHFNPNQMFSIQIINNNLSPEDFVEIICKSEYGPDYLKSSGFKKITTTNGQTFYYFNSGGIGEGTFEHVFFSNSYIVSFKTNESSITYDTNPEFAQILSTFKFDKQ